MRHRVFIAINLPENIKKKLISFQDKWSELPVRWVKPENLHITLAFLGYLSNEELLEVIKITKEVSNRCSLFSINLKKVIYGPPKKPSGSSKFSEKFWRPRMIWVEGEKSEQLGKLQKDLENSLAGLSVEQKNEKGSRYILHITLGRIRQWEFRQIEPEERPEINEDIDLSFEVNSIEVMESQLKRGGAEYSILESIPLKV